MAIFAGLLVVSGAAVVAIRRHILGASSQDGLADLTSHEPGPYEAAMLKGGDRLVLTASACRLTEAGSVRPADAGKGIVVAGPPPAHADAVEKWVYWRVQDGQGAAKSVLDAKAADSVLLPIRQRLWALGLLVEPGQATSLRLQLIWFLPAAALGVARLIAGASSHKPIGYLVVLLIAGGIGAAMLTSAPIATTEGRRLLKRLDKDSAGLSSYGFAADVALSGVAASGPPMPAWPRPWDQPIGERFRR